MYRRTVHARWWRSDLQGRHRVAQISDAPLKIGPQGEEIVDLGVGGVEHCGVLLQCVVEALQEGLDDRIHVGEVGAGLSLGSGGDELIQIGVVMVGWVVSDTRCMSRDDSSFHYTN